MKQESLTTDAAGILGTLLILSVILNAFLMTENSTMKGQIIELQERVKELSIGEIVR